MTDNQKLTTLPKGQVQRQDFLVGGVLVETEQRVEPDTQEAERRTQDDE